MFNCPSRSGRFATIGIDVYALNDYAGVMASWNDPGWNGFAWQTSVAPIVGEQTIVWTGILAKGGQVNKSSTPPQIWKFGTVGFKSIEDGASHTILLAEKSVAAQYYTIPSSNPWPYWEMYGYYTGGQAQESPRSAYKERPGAQPADTFATYLWQTGADLLTAPITPGTRAALFRVLAEQHGLTATSQVSDAVGRRGVAVSLTAPGDASTRGDVEYRMIIDPGTAELLQIEVRDRRPVALLTQTFERMGWVDRLGQQPEG